ncbi:hypothetical protein [Halosimplex pelagicum]|uniref:Uncharacterized protein n=1 Tax=Halosimplex pelagicum TaxID=869886 RepID=A0A7D5TFZ3_9EURY|nr:hypothetical protein [Halosimplex pelagicum]QLH84735.1 hypothetical protein HZS54_25185 [Halosimplex pelagicum]
MDREDIALALALLVGVALTGQVAGLVESAGFEGLGSLVWPIGYGSVVLAAWFVWIRPMDLGATDPDDTDLWGPDDEQTDPDR